MSKARLAGVTLALLLAASPGRTTGRQRRRLRRPILSRRRAP
jgi:hypothetical protein